MTSGPEIERVKPAFVIVRWTNNNPGGSPERYGVVHYATNPKELSQTAKSPISAFAVQRCGVGEPPGVLRKRREYYADNYVKLMKTEWSNATDD